MVHFKDLKKLRLVLIIIPKQLHLIATPKPLSYLINYHDRSSFERQAISLHRSPFVTWQQVTKLLEYVQLASQVLCFLGPHLMLSLVCFFPPNNTFHFKCMTCFTHSKSFSIHGINNTICLYVLNVSIMLSVIYFFTLFFCQLLD